MRSGHAWGCILACNNAEIDRSAIRARSTSIAAEGEIRQGNVPINHDNSARATPRLVGEIKTFARERKREKTRYRLPARTFRRGCTHARASNRPSSRDQPSLEPLACCSLFADSIRRYFARFLKAQRDKRMWNFNVALIALWHVNEFDSERHRFRENQSFLEGDRILSVCHSLR